MGGEESNLNLQGQLKRADPQKEYLFQIPALGSGSFGIAYKAIRISDKKVFCIKQSNEIKNDEDWKNYEKEFIVLRDLNHPNIIRCFEAFIYTKHFYLILEYAEEGDLNKLVGNLNNEAEILKLSFQIIEGFLIFIPIT
jgi:serine/threonine protein kinase